ncbi:MAG: hypothetical protein IKO99_08355 [Bacteroidales bacterium]|nr:hypothetical protein [Bacteroidales bacterium]
MNRTFIKVLPLAAAVLLATSCSKEDNNNEIVNNGQEKVEKQFKTITVKGNAGKKQGISKISLDEGTGAISFEKDDEISFSGSGVSGKGQFINDNGDFIADLTFTADAVVTDVEISATIGTALTDAVVCGSWSEIANYLYETSSATSTLKETGGVYEFESPFTMVPQIAILKNTSGADATYSIGEVTDQTLANGSILVVNNGTTVTINGKTATVSAGNSYNIAPTPAAPTVTGEFELTTNGTVNYTISSSIEGLEYSTGNDEWSDLSSKSVQNLSSGATLSFRTKKTSTAYASQVKEVTVPTVSSVQVSDKTFYYLDKEGSITWSDDVVGVTVNEDENVVTFTENGNTYQIFADNNPATDLLDNTKTYTYKQVLTVTITDYSGSESFNLTYYKDETWENVAARNNNVSVMVDEEVGMPFVIIGEGILGVYLDSNPDFVIATDVVDNTKAYIIYYGTNP